MLFSRGAQRVDIGTVTVDQRVTFSLIMLSLVLAFVPAAAVHKAIWWLGRGRKGLALAPAPQLAA